MPTKTVKEPVVQKESIDSLLKSLEAANISLTELLVELGQAKAEYQEKLGAVTARDKDLADREIKIKVGEEEHAKRVSELKGIQNDIDEKMGKIKQDEELSRLMIEADEKMGRAREIQKQGENAIAEAVVREEQVAKRETDLQEAKNNYRQEIEKELLKKFIS